MQPIGQPRLKKTQSTKRTDFGPREAISEASGPDAKGSRYYNEVFTIYDLLIKRLGDTP